MRKRKQRDLDETLTAMLRRFEAIERRLAAVEGHIPPEPRYSLADLSRIHVPPALDLIYRAGCQCNGTGGCAGHPVPTPPQTSDPPQKGPFACAFMVRVVVQQVAHGSCGCTTAKACWRHERGYRLEGSTHATILSDPPQSHKPGQE